jgi:hypothetical protein
MIDAHKLNKKHKPRLDKVGEIAKNNANSAKYVRAANAFLKRNGKRI